MGVVASQRIDQDAINKIKAKYEAKAAKDLEKFNNELKAVNEEEIEAKKETEKAYKRLALAVA